MFKPVTKKVVATKNLVYKHRVGIAVAITATLMMKMQFATAKQFNEFLKAHGLYDEYYAALETEAV